MGFADRILILNTDPVSTDEVRALEQRLKRMNARAPITAAHFGQAPIDQLLDIRGFNLNASLEIEPDFLTDVPHEHDDDVTSFVLRAERPLDNGRLDEFFGAILQVYGPKLMRYKGLIAVAGVGKRVVQQGLHMLMGSDQGAAWKQAEARDSKIVFIGKDMPKDVILEGLEQCLVPVGKGASKAKAMPWPS